MLGTVFDLAAAGPGDAAVVPALRRGHLAAHHHRPPHAEAPPHEPARRPAHPPAARHRPRPRPGRPPSTAVLTLADSGVTLIEVSLTSADALDTIARARAALGPGFALGAGTVLTADDARAAADAGANFLVTPAIAPSLAEAARLGAAGARRGADPHRGRAGRTPAGAAAVKLFPASSAARTTCGALRDPFPQTAFVPVGGVDAARAERYLQAGAVAVGVGSPLLGDAVRGGDLGGAARTAPRPSSRGPRDDRRAHPRRDDGRVPDDRSAAPGRSRRTFRRRIRVAPWRSDWPGSATRPPGSASPAPTNPANSYAARCAPKASTSPWPASTRTPPPA